MTRHRTDADVADALEQYLRDVQPTAPLPSTRLAHAVGASTPRVVRVLNAYANRFRSHRHERTGRFTWHLRRSSHGSLRVQV